MRSFSEGWPLVSKGAPSGHQTHWYVSGPPLPFCRVYHSSIHVSRRPLHCTSGTLFRESNRQLGCKTAYPFCINLAREDRTSQEGALSEQVFHNPKTRKEALIFPRTTRKTFLRSPSDLNFVSSGRSDPRVQLSPQQQQRRLETFEKFVDGQPRSPRPRNNALEHLWQGKVWRGRRKGERKRLCQRASSLGLMCMRRVRIPPPAFSLDS